jgi:hypothetical protein
VILCEPSCPHHSGSIDSSMHADAHGVLASLLVGPHPDDHDERERRVEVHLRHPLSVCHRGGNRVDQFRRRPEPELAPVARDHPRADLGADADNGSHQESHRAGEASRARLAGRCTLTRISLSVSVRAAPSQRTPHFLSMISWPDSRALRPATLAAALRSALSAGQDHHARGSCSRRVHDDGGVSAARSRPPPA